LVEFALGDYDGGPNIQSIAGVGTDHGLLAMGLAFSCLSSEKHPGLPHIRVCSRVPGVASDRIREWARC
jgi:hypothetical protein